MKTHWLFLDHQGREEYRTENEQKMRWVNMGDPDSVGGDRVSLKGFADSSLGRKEYQGSWSSRALPKTFGRNLHGHAKFAFRHFAVFRGPQLNISSPRIRLASTAAVGKNRPATQKMTQNEPATRKWPVRWTCWHRYDLQMKLYQYPVTSVCRQKIGEKAPVAPVGGFVFGKSGKKNEQNSPFPSPGTCARKTIK